MRTFSVLLVLLAACAPARTDSTPLPAGRPPTIVETDITTEVTVPPSRAIVTDSVLAPPETAWRALKRAWADLGIEAAETSEAELWLSNPRFVVTRRLSGQPLSKYLECGSGMLGPFADRYRIQMSIRSGIVTDGAGGSRVSTYIEAVGQNREGSSNTTVMCSSNYRLERELAQRVRLYSIGG
ncbi:MAG: hypothetical protein AMXMBFR53_40970 [Gemmatimonadota bacterium]